MKSNYYLLALIIATTMLFASCGETITNTLIVEDLIFVHEEATTEIKISQGNGKYVVRSTDTSIATADIDGSTIITTGIKEGECNLILKDAAGKTTTIHVIVWPPFVSFKSSLSDLSRDWGISFEETTNSLGQRALTVKPGKATKLIKNSSLPVSGNQGLQSESIINIVEKTPAVEQIVFNSFPLGFGFLYNGDYYLVSIISIDTNSIASGIYIKPRK